MADFNSTVQNATPAHPSTFAPVAAVALGAGCPISIDPSSGEAVKSRANAAATAQVAGLVRAPAAAGDNAIVQYGDVLKLTEEQWDGVTGGSGGLTPNARYYLSAASAGLITETAPSGGGNYVAPIGLAISSTELLVQLAEGVEASS